LRHHPLWRTSKAFAPLYKHKSDGPIVLMYVRDMKEQQKEFYDRCAELLGIDHEYTEPVLKRTRWNSRRNGNGRYPGFGLIRCYGDTVVIITSKYGTKTFPNFDEVYKFLEEINK